MFNDDDSKEFNPDRWGNSSGPEPSVPVKEFLPFGSGSRSCAGKDFARLLLKVLIFELVRNCSWDVSGKSKIKYFPVPHPTDGLPTHFTGNEAFRRRSNTY